MNIEQSPERPNAQLTVQEYNLVAFAKEVSILIERETYSAEVAPRKPVLKFSMERTVFFSRGTLVPPEVTRTTFLAS